MGGSGWEAPAKGAKKEVLDMPVTYVTRVRSSGYGESSSPRGTLGKGRGSSQRGRASSAPRGSNGGGRVIPTYTPLTVPLTVHQPQHRLPPPVPAPVLAIAYSGDAKHLAVVSGGADLVLPCFRLPLSKHKGAGMVH